MKLSECKHGTLVIDNNECVRVGMVIGLSENPLKEAVPKVQWQDGITDLVHHVFLDLYEE